MGFGVENTFGFILRWPGGFDQNKTGGDSVKPGGVSGSDTVVKPNPLRESNESKPR